MHDYVEAIFLTRPSERVLPGVTLDPPRRRDDNLSQMAHMEFGQLADAGVDVTPGLAAIYARAKALWGSKPIVFDIYFRHGAAVGGMRSYEDRVQIWTAPSGDRTTRLIHELARAVIQRACSSPRLTPNASPPPERAVLSDLISMPEHVLVHAVMEEYGVNASEEARDRSTTFMAGIPTAHLGPRGDNVHLSIEYALMQTAYRCDDLLTDIYRAVRARSAEVARLGDALADYVRSKRTTTLFDDAQRLMQLASVGPELRESVISQKEFERRYGWL